MNFKFSHDFDTDARTYWDIFWSEDYNRELYRQLHMRSRQVLVQTNDQTGPTEQTNVIRRSQRLEPTMAIPSWAAKTIRDISYVEHDVYYRDTSRMEVRIEPTLAKDRFKMFGVYQVVDLADQRDQRRCRREFNGEVHIAVPLLGPKIEQMMIDQVKEAYETAARVTRDFITRLKAQPAT